MTRGSTIASTDVVFFPNLARKENFESGRERIGENKKGKERGDEERGKEKDDKK